MQYRNRQPIVHTEQKAVHRVLPVIPSDNGAAGSGAGGALR